MSESKKSINFFGTCSKAPLAQCLAFPSGNLQVLPKERRPEAHSIIQSLGVKRVKFNAAVRRIEATR